jgi:aminomethyltransferase
LTGTNQTTLFDIHKAAGARFITYAGFSMPVQYTSIIAEHRTVRESAGIFDVSHMGQINLSGPGAKNSLEQLLTCRVSSLPIGAVRYGCMCNKVGGTIDDITLYRLETDEFFLCVNAANISKNLKWILSNTSNTKVVNKSLETSLFALQGPKSPQILEAIGISNLRNLKRFRFRAISVGGCQALLSRTGYTGTDGFEIYLSIADSKKVWETIFAAGEIFGLKPAGLGARDTLRLEAAYPLYGQELTEKLTPLQAGLHRFVKLEEGGFIGHKSLIEQASEGNSKMLVGFQVEGRGIARTNYPIIHNGRTIGHVTSGTFSPTLQRSIGLGYVESRFADLETEFQVLVRNRPIEAKVCQTPFVRDAPKRSQEEQN